jgi:imidazolonepropionase-like amidohydrolase
MAIMVLAGGATRAQDGPIESDADRVPSITTNGNCLIKNGTLLTVTHGVIKSGDILVQNGKIVAIGPNLTAPAGVTVIDATGKFVTPGIVDAHSHIAIDSVNEGANSITAEVQIRDVLNPDSLSLYRGLSSGVTASLLLHGSANSIGGQSLVIKMKYKHPVDELPVPDAPGMVKFALGENVKQSNRFPGENSTRYPNTRMGVESVYRRAFNDAREYMRQWDAYEKRAASDPSAIPPRRDLRLEALSNILKRKLWVQCHSYRADEMLMMLRLSKEFGFKLAALQHALEAYKIAPEIKAAGAGVSTFSSDWAYKIEAFDAIPYNAAVCMREGIVTSVNSDNEEGTYRLNIEAARCMKYGGLTENEALSLITINPAIQLGIDHRTGSLEIGKDADIAIWQGYPLSVFSKCVTTMVEGTVYFQRRDAFGIDAQSTTHQDVTHCKVDSLSIPLPKPSHTYAITGGTVHPISGPDIPNGIVVMTDGKIVAVGKSVHIPSGAVVVNARGLQVYPGMIDAGTHMGLEEIGSINATHDAAEAGEFQPDLLSLTAVNPASEHLAVTRITGVTTAVSKPSGVIAGQGALINLAGWTPEEMKVRGKLALFIQYPEGLDPEQEQRLLQFQGQDAVDRRRTEVNDQIKHLKEHLDAAKRYAAARAANYDMPVDLRMEAMRPYIEGKQPIVFEANATRAIRGVIKLADEYHLKVILSGGDNAWRVAGLIASKKIPLIYSVPLIDSLGYGHNIGDLDPYDTLFAAPAILKKAGVQFCFASEDAPQSRNLPSQVGLLCAYGLSPEVALRQMTLGAAEILGVDDVVGSLDAGKIANVIVTDGDPLEINTDVHYLFIAGKPVSLETRHTRLYKQYLVRVGEPAVLTAPDPVKGTR